MKLMIISVIHNKKIFLNINMMNVYIIILIFFVLKSYFFYLIGYGLDTFIINIFYDCTFIFLITFAFYIFKKIKKNDTQT